MNTFSFTGNLGGDCRTGNAGGTAVCNFSVAVKSGYGDKAQTHWVDCAVWGKQAESRLPEYLLKGQQVAISGELGTREHEGKTYLTCRVVSIDLIGKRDDSGQPQQPQNRPAQQSQQARQNPPASDFDDDIDEQIPF